MYCVVLWALGWWSWTILHITKFVFYKCLWQTFVENKHKRWTMESWTQTFSETENFTCTSCQNITQAKQFRMLHVFLMFLPLSFVCWYLEMSAPIRVHPHLDMDYSQLDYPHLYYPDLDFPNLDFNPIGTQSKWVSPNRVSPNDTPQSNWRLSNWG